MALGTLKLRWIYFMKKVYPRHIYEGGTVELEFEEYNEDFDKENNGEENLEENNGEENLEDTIPPISTEEDKIISGDMIASGLMQ